MNRPIFTIGQVWPEFVKRLPRQLPRYRGEQSPNPSPYQLFAAMQAQCQPRSNPYMQPSSYPLGGYGAAVGGLFIRYL